MIVVDPYKRLPASEALLHPYLTTTSDIELADAVKNIKKLQAIKRFKKIANGVIIARRLSKAAVNSKAFVNRGNNKIDISAVQKVKLDEDSTDFDDDEIAIVQREIPDIST